MAELYYDENMCLQRKQERGPWVENFAIKQGHTHFYYDMHCIETMMIPHVPKNNTWQSHKILLYPNLEPSGSLGDLMTDVTKYKSIAVKIEAYQKAKPMAESMYMSMEAFIRYLIDKEYKQKFKEIKKNGEDLDVRAEWKEYKTSIIRRGGK